MLKHQFVIKKELDLDSIQKLTNSLEKFESEILLLNQKQSANCKSLINLLAIGITSLKFLEFKIKGKDEQKVLTFLQTFLQKQ